MVLNRLFDNSSLVAGQEVAVGGVIHTAKGVDSLIPKRVVLMPQGVAGTLAGDASVVAGNVGSFPLEIRTRSIASLLLPSPLTVRTTHETRFIDLGGLSELMGDEPIHLRVVGFVLLNASDQPVQYFNLKQAGLKKIMVFPEMEPLKKHFRRVEPKAATRTHQDLQS